MIFFGKPVPAFPDHARASPTVRAEMRLVPFCRSVHRGTH